MPIRRSWLAAACLIACCPLYAQEAAPRPPASGWRLGGIALVHNGGYLGDARRTLVVPAVGYESEQVFFRGLRLGWHAYRQQGLQLDLVAQARLDGFDAADVPIPGLQDRRASIDAGAVLTLSGDAGKLEFTALTDVLDRSAGQELALDYGYPFRAGRARVTPTVGVRWWSAAMADYYYGIRPFEVARGAPASYHVSSALVPEVGIDLLLPLDRRWAMFGLLRHQRLPGTIANSPLVSGSSASTLLVGVTYAF